MVHFIWDIISITELLDGHSWIGITSRTPGLVAVDAEKEGSQKSPAVGFDAGNVILMANKRARSTMRRSGYSPTAESASG